MENTNIQIWVVIVAVVLYLLSQVFQSFRKPTQAAQTSAEKPSRFDEIIPFLASYLSAKPASIHFNLNMALCPPPDEDVEIRIQLSNTHDSILSPKDIGITVDGRIVNPVDWALNSQLGHEHHILTIYRKVFSTGQRHQLLIEYRFQPVLASPVPWSRPTESKTQNSPNRKVNAKAPQAGSLNGIHPQEGNRSQEVKV